MGARARTALAVAVVPHGPEAKVEAELAAMLAGACRVLAAAGCALVGGHSSEGPELALGALQFAPLCKDSCVQASSSPVHGWAGGGHS